MKTGSLYLYVEYDDVSEMMFSDAQRLLFSIDWWWILNLDQGESEYYDLKMDIHSTLM